MHPQYALVYALPVILSPCSWPAEFITHIFVGQFYLILLTGIIIKCYAIPGIHLINAITCLTSTIIVSYHALHDLGDIVRFEVIFICDQFSASLCAIFILSNQCILSALFQRRFHQ